jgi:two-component system response regulator HydG
VFLDGIELLPSPVQEALSEALETRSFARQGCEKAITLEVRVLASATDSPERLIARGVVSKRLVDAFGSRCLTLPALRDRALDIPLLVGVLAQRHDPSRACRFSSEVLWAFACHDWPRNVRELEEVVQSLLHEVESDEIGLEDLPSWLHDCALGTAIDFDETMFPQAPRLGVAPARNGRAPAGEISLQAYEKRALVDALERADGDKLGAARILNIGKSTLYRKLKKHGID